MPVPTAITDLSTTAASNYPAGTDSPSTLDDVQRAHASFIAQLRDGSGFTAGALIALVTAPTELASVNGGQLAGLRNRIINGGMQVAQRGNVALANNTQVYGGADRWICAIGNFTTASGTAGQITGQPATSFSTGCLQSIQNLTSTGSGFVQFRQRIESANSYALNGKTITISGTVYQDTGSTQSFDVALFKANAADNFATTTIVSNATKSATNATLTRFTQTVTLGSTDASNGLELIINFTAVGAVTNKNFYLGDVQLEIGSVATPFEQRPIGLELALCQRYLPAYKSSTTVDFVSSGGLVSNATDASFPVTHTVTPRTAPTGVTVSSASHFSINAASGGGVAGAVTFVNGGLQNSRLLATSTGMTAGQSTQLYGNTASASLLFTGCEL